MLVVTASAKKIARGTVRAGSWISPLGTSAISTPTNAKISSEDGLAQPPPAGIDGSATPRACTNKTPTPTKMTSGSSFASVRVSISRPPPRRHAR